MSGAWGTYRSRSTRVALSTRAAKAVAPFVVALGALLGACSRQAEPEMTFVSAELLVESAGASSGEGHTRPLQGAVVSGTMHVVLATAQALSNVQFILNDGETPMAEVASAPYSTPIDTTKLAVGENRIRAVMSAPGGGSDGRAVAATFHVIRGDPQVEPPAPDPGLGPAPDPDPDPVPPYEPPSDWAPPDGAVWIALGQDAQHVVDANPAGTTFVFAAGTHRLRAAIVPRLGDTFLGEPGAILSGARVLDVFEQVGDLWAARGQTQQGYVGPGSCVAEAPRCRYPEELFVDDVRLLHVSRREDVTAGTWTFDYAADTIYLADDPRGRRVETSVTQAAVFGNADHVTVRGLVIEKFANAAQQGAIMADREMHGMAYGRSWRIEDNVVRWNHGVGIRAGHGAVIRGNRVIGNGQLGISSVGGHGTLVEENEIAYNNGAGFDSGWEAGGTKFVSTSGLVVRANHVHRNAGPGLWTDYDNVDTVYEENLVERNDGSGIFHEISYRATIRHNVVRANGLRAGLSSYAYVFGAGILVYASSDVEVYGNVVDGNWNGIVGLMHDRGSGAYGVHELRGLHVHDNDVTMRFHADGVGPQGERGVWGVSGVAQAGGYGFVFEPASGNRFDANRYIVSDIDGAHYTWRDGNRRFSVWTQTYGQDAGGTIAQGVDGGTLATRP